MERRVFLGAVVVVSAILAALLSTRGPGHEAVELNEFEAAIESRRAEIELGLSSGSLAIVMDGYTEDARLFPLSDDPVVGKEAIEAYYSQGLLPRSRVLESLELQGELAIEHGSLGFDGGKYLAVWRYSGESWRIMLDLQNLLE